MCIVVPCIDKLAASMTARRQSIVNANLKRRQQLRALRSSPISDRHE
jgi:hypothetical protein